MTKKELLESVAFQSMPDDTIIVFKTHKNRLYCEQLTPRHCILEKQCTNMQAIQEAPLSLRRAIEPKYKDFFVIDAMPFDYMKNELNMTFTIE